VGDPTTIALNLTFFGTVFVAFVMSIGLFIIFTAMLLIAGAGRLTALIVMALFGRFPKNDTIEVVRLSADGQIARSVPVAEPANSHPAEDRPGKTRPAKPRLPRTQSTSRPVRAPRPPIDWKKLLTRAGLEEALRTAVVHHPLVTAARPVPPVLAKDWADAVAAADARAVARARAAAPTIDVPVRDVPVTGTGEIVKVAPLVESALHHGARAPLTQVPPPPSHAPGEKRSGNGAKSPQPAQPLTANSAQPARPAKKPANAAHMAILDTGSMVSLAQHTESRIRS
jgi:hypothetical protein